MGHPSRLGLIDSQEPVERDHPLNQGLVAWWLGLDNNSGGGTLFDLCGKYPGTLTNGPTWAPGPHGFGGLALDGSNDCVQAAGVDLSAYSAVTASFWLKADTWKTSASQYDMLMEHTASTSSNVGGFTVYNDGFAGLVAAHNGNVGLSQANHGSANRPAAGQWVHLTFVGDYSLATKEVALYLNGVYQTPTTWQANNNNASGTAYANSTFNLGRRNNTSLPFDGQIADVRIVGRALPAAEVFALYEQSLRGHPDTLRRYSTTAWFASPPASSGAEGTLSATLSAPTLSAAGTVAVVGSATITLAAPFSTAAGTVAVVGAAAVTLVAPTPTSAGTVAVAGAAAPTLAAPTLSAAGAVAVVGAATPTLTAPASTAAGTVAVVGTLSATLAAPTLTAAGTSGSVGTATITLAAPASTAAGTVAVAGEATPTLTAPTPAATGTVSLSGSAGVTLALPALSAAGAVAVTAELAAALAGYTLTAAGTVAESSGLTATLAVTLDGPTLLAAGRGRRRAFDPAGDMALFDADRSMIDPSSDMDYFD